MHQGSVVCCIVISFNLCTSFDNTINDIVLLMANSKMEVGMCVRSW